MYPKGYEIVASWEVPTDGNAVPYTRMTQRQAKIANYRNIQRYFDWKRLICASAMNFVGIGQKGFNPTPKEKVYLYVHVYFKDRTHGDPDNILKGIADSIYTQDKYVAGCVDFGYDKENPRIVITILEKPVIIEEE
jgi:hypothetical protein